VSDSTISLRRTQGRLLLWPSTRTIRWVALAVLVCVGVLAVWTGGRKGADPSEVGLPVATTLLCVWLCFLFEDIAAETTDPTATPLAARRAVRAAIAVPAATAVWFAFTWVGPLHGPTATMAGSFAAEALLALAAAAVASRIDGPARGGFSAVGVLVFVAIVLPIWLGRPPVIEPTHPPFGTPMTYWSAIAAISAFVLASTHVTRNA